MTYEHRRYGVSSLQIELNGRSIRAWKDAATPGHIFTDVKITEGELTCLIGIFAQMDSALENSMREILG